MTVVQNIPVDSSGGLLTGAAATITLVTSSDTSPGYTGTQTLVAPKVVYTDATTGRWSADLIPNSLITPANTYYRVTEPNGEISDIIVPASGGPYNLSQVLSTPPPTPSAPGITGVQVAQSGTVVGVRPEVNLVPGSNISLTVTDNPGSNRVDVTVTSTAGGAGPATTVTDETTYGVAKAVGTAVTYAREDHTHGSPSLASTNPAASAPGDTAAVGSGATPAKSDHRHAREAFGAVVAQTAYGAAAADGTASTVSHSDHAHGTPPLPNTTLAFSVPGTVAVAVGGARIYNDAGRTLTIRAIRATVGAAPTGASLIVDVNKNGTTVFTTQANRPTIAAAGNTSGKVTNMDVTSIADGDYLTVDVDQVGSTVAGADLTVQVWVA